MVDPDRGVQEQRYECSGLVQRARDRNTELLNEHKNSIGPGIAIRHGETVMLDYSWMRNCCIACGYTDMRKQI